MPHRPEARRARPASSASRRPAGRGRPAHALGRAPAADLGPPARAQLAREELGRTAQRIAGLGETEVLCEAGERVVEAAEVIGGEPPVVPGRRKARSETSRLREARERLLHAVESREGVALVVPVAGLGGREPDRLVEAGEPFLEPAELREQHALRPPCRLVARVEGEGAVVAVEGRGVASRRQHVPLVVPGERIAWVGLDRLVEAAQLLGRPAEPAQDDPLRDPGLRAARVERERAIERGQARLEPTLVHEQQTLVEPGIGRVGVECDRLLESGVRLLQPAEAAQGVALVRVDLRLAGGECERAVVADDGLVESPQADQRDPAVRQVGGRVLDRRRGLGFPAGLGAIELLEVDAQRGEARVPFFRTLAERTGDQGRERRGERRRLRPVVQIAERAEVEGGGRNAGRRRTRHERQPPAARDLVEHHAEAVDVAPLVAERGAFELLGRHVRGRAEDRPEPRAPGIAPRRLGCLWTFRVGCRARPAMPKSEIRTRSSSPIRTFAGLMSRWQRMPRLAAYSMPWQNWIAQGSDCARSGGRVARKPSRLLGWPGRPRTYSIAR